MKKARFIGILMAAVMAAAPVTGLTGNVLSFNDNVIVAEAAWYPSSILITGGNRVLWTSDSLYNFPQFQNGDYQLYFRSGRIVITKTIQKQGKKTEIITRMFETGGNMLALQEDGNLVTYTNNGKTPTAHSNTYDTTKMTKHGYNYKYSLTKEGNFIIQRINPTGNVYTIWDSSKDTMYRI